MAIRRQANLPRSIERRRVRAAERAAERATRTPEQQVAELARRGHAGCREVARLLGVPFATRLEVAP